MHVSNHLISPEVSIVGGVVAALLIGVAVIKTHKEQPSSKRLTLAGILGAFVFAAQMFNFPIGALGCSGHLVGGVLLAAMLGPWLGFLTLSGVLTLQALVFADGGIMTLGWNIVNMAALGSLVAYPLIFRPIIKASAATARCLTASIVTSVAALSLGAMAVVFESTLSGNAALPFAEFMANMLPIHLLIGAIEGATCGVILLLVARREPALLEAYRSRLGSLRINYKRVFTIFALASLVVGGIFSLMASSHPDGLEWAIGKTLGGEVIEITNRTHLAAESLQQSIALAPDYEGSYTGLWATAAILLCTWLFVGTSGSRRKESQAEAQPLASTPRRK